MSYYTPIAVLEELGLLWRAILCNPPFSFHCAIAAHGPRTETAKATGASDHERKSVMPQGK